MADLSAWGFDSFFAEQLDQRGRAEIPARVASEHRGAYEVWSENGAGRATLAGRLRHDDAGALLPGVGDWVVLSAPPGPDHSTVIDRVLQRRTLFCRGAAGREARAQVVAANVDRVLIVSGLDGDFNLRRIERTLARVWASGAEAVVVLNKVDLCDDVYARVAAVERHAGAEVAVLVTSASSGEGVEEVRACIHPGETVALVGSSGAGKSTLVNALVGAEVMRTAAVRIHDSRGRHSTTHRQLIALPSGGVLLDTPGMRALSLIDEEGLEVVFADIAALATGCRFRDCRHGDEPGCAVQAAIRSGALLAERFAHFQALEREAQANALRHDVRKRRQAERVWGQLADEVALLRKWKGGKP